MQLTAFSPYCVCTEIKQKEQFANSVYKYTNYYVRNLFLMLLTHSYKFYLAFILIREIFSLLPLNNYYYYPCEYLMMDTHKLKDNIV